MATLAEINQTLNRVDDNTENTSRGIGTFVKFLQDNKRKDLEAAREKKNVVVPNIQPKADTTVSKEKSSGMFDGIRNMLAGASLAKLAPLIGKGLLKRVLLPATIATFSDEIVDFLLPELNHFLKEPSFIPL